MIISKLVLEKDMNQEPWSETEDEIIIKARRKFGANFGWILEQQLQSKMSMLGSFRSARQIISRLQELESIAHVKDDNVDNQNGPENADDPDSDPDSILFSSELWRKSYDKRFPSIKKIAGALTSKERPPLPFLIEDESAINLEMVLNPLQVLEKFGEVPVSELLKSE